MQSSINFSALETYKGSALKIKHILPIVALILLAFIFAGTGIFGSYILIVFLFLGGSLIFYSYNFSKSQKKERQAILSAFAQQNNFHYVVESNHGFGPGTLFTHGHSREAADIISGEIDGLPFSFFQYDYVTGSGKSRRSYDATVMEIILPRKLPHMVIDSVVEADESGSSTLPIYFDKSQMINLEGDFSQYFKLYAPDNYGISALTILAPDVMQVLLRNTALCDIEIIDDRLYFYWPHVSRNQSDFMNKFATVQETLKETKQKLTKSDIFATASQAKIHAQPGKGVRLKSTNNLFMTIVVILFVVIYSFNSFIPASITEWLSPLFMIFFIIAIGSASINRFRQKRLRKQMTQRYGLKQ